MAKPRTGTNGISVPRASKRSVNALTPCITIATSRPNRFSKCFSRTNQAIVYVLLGNFSRIVYTANA
ncbi:hypothetical protein IQ230_16205 [Gloeocapsopsis crepidinum LEGE 06123]|uniref:Uncharacterized protein n=1 Tax=Gloeocapsopsis crepidinum LEGE 06123 TaxID=588587 RepID=A0ABR9UU83_9CHRO|nr:hypothetical protein [Gloeocapsopsis crepidinum]MBE9191864.1 hypothetical protein [Gloeocapsopsis crepidinum LEGE 06123]